MKPVGKRGHRIVHAERVRILDGGAYFGEEAVDRRSKLGHRAPNGRWRGRDEVAVLNGEQSFAERRQGARALAVGPFGGHVADEQAEGAGDEGGKDLLIHRGEINQRTERKQE